MANVATHAGLVTPTSFAFAPDGRLFIAEKRGTIQTYDSVADSTPTLFADLRSQVHNFYDRGLLSIEVDVDWPNRRNVYVLMSYDAPVDRTAPVYGGADDSDPCPSTGCPAQTRLVKLTADATATMTEQVPLITNVCREFPAHDGGGLRMSPDRQLYVSFGDGASPADFDYGQLGGNPCGDPPLEGGSLRSQDARTTGDDLGSSGSVVRVNPDTGATTLLADGLRNPFRLALRPGTSELFVTDVGNQRVEEINRIPASGSARNFGWPCFEGHARQGQWDTADLPICETLYADGTATPPDHYYCHAGTVPACEPGAGSLSGIEFYEGGAYDDKYDGGLFFADYTRKEIQVALATNGIPDFSRIESFATDIGFPVDLRTGPGGDLFYIDVFNNRLNRLYMGDPAAPPDPSNAPSATISSPLGDETLTVGGTVSFDGGATSATGAPLPAADLRWTLAVQHCTGEISCHRHFVEDRVGVRSGSFTIPSHDGAWKAEVLLTATDAGGEDRTSVIVADQPR